MDVLQQVTKLGRTVADSAVGAIRGRRTVCVYITNGTSLELIKSSDQVKGGTTCTPSFNQLLSGRAGCLRFANNGDLGGIVTLEIAGEKMLVKVSNSSMGKPWVDIAWTANSGDAARPSCSTSDLEAPASEVKRVRSNAEILVDQRVYSKGGQAALVTRRHGTYDFVAHVVISSTSETTANEVTGIGLLLSTTLYTSQLMSFACWCQEKAPEILGAAVFMLELVAVEAGLDGLDLIDQAFMLNLLIKGFLTNRALASLGLDVQAETQLWRTKAPGPLAESADAELLRYGVYREASSSDLRLGIEAYAEAALVLLKTAAGQSAMNEKVSKALSSWADAGGLQQEAKMCNLDQNEAGRESTVNLNIRVLEEHLNAKPKPTQEIHAKPETSPDGATPQVSVEVVMMSLVRGCIHDSADFAIGREALFEAFSSSIPDEGRAALRHYREWVPGALRSFASDEADMLVRIGGPKKKKKACCGCCGRRRKKKPELGVVAGTCVSLGSEVFQGLDGGTAASPSQLLASLGRDAPPFRVLSTNSKSGEFFFFTGDGKYLVKTVSEAEGKLLFRMLPGYQGHMKVSSRSLIVRYAGLYRVELRDGDATWITVMASVFEHAKPCHMSYDLKGSMHGRKKKDGEKVGKDQDWKEQGICLRLPDQVRREFCAAHEQDATFLMSYGVMDYSLLVGFHDLAEGSETGHGWRAAGGGLWAEGGKQLYFAGMIDFLIAYDIKKQSEHILRVLQDHAEDASCVDPVTYARRNVHFIRESVVALPEGTSLDDAGTLGGLKATIISAKNLVNMDGLISKSDPYVTVSLGLVRAKTPVIKDNLNPEWNCTLALPVDVAHQNMDVILEVWDEDTNKKLQGSDDTLGRTFLPLKQIIEEKTVDLSKALVGRTSGELTARLEWVPLGN